MGLLATEARDFPSPACGRGRGPPPSGGGRVRVFLFLNPADQRFANDVNNAVQVAQNVIVPEAENLETFGFEEGRPLGRRKKTLTFPPPSAAGPLHVAFSLIVLKMG